MVSTGLARILRTIFTFWILYNAILHRMTVTDACKYTIKRSNNSTHYIVQCLMSDSKMLLINLTSMFSCLLTCKSKWILTWSSPVELSIQIYILSIQSLIIGLSSKYCFSRHNSAMRTGWVSDVEYIKPLDLLCTTHIIAWK